MFQAIFIELLNSLISKRFLGVRQISKLNFEHPTTDSITTLDNSYLKNVIDQKVFFRLPKH